ncbi:AFR095Cp [Eremothecium gossypii ATCC 10895]|uniref:AFR095Cp n=1 Tax=Eremothecium gossypii (strain ATCC 10895 / CBS 109.51 / FGSC 9923 / NRRL Y-1056) TaxID=284811 RepID=Q754I1_EREGS|nr:AFR095Cp [Eremothecium gossypii ATCC 10895]AAS53466.2 AFR095Cp [Eremothecium gossypii ATCC 10895]AEY97778.1 FAFR095Cp [Eremothecium gossypii FDAG1]
MSKPFQGITFCPTGVADSELAELHRRVVQLGGAFSRDLTAEVHVLVVGNQQSAKYRYVVRQRADVVLVEPQGVEEVYARWLAGEEALGPEGEGGREQALRALRRRFQPGPFGGFYVFIGRVAGGRVSAAELQQLCESGGARRVVTSHFVRDTASSARSVFVTDCAEGARAAAAREQGVAVVHPKWVTDCVRRGAVVEMEEYELARWAGAAWEEVGRDACACWAALEAAAARSAEREARPARLSGRMRRSGTELWARRVEGGGSARPAAADAPAAAREAGATARGLFGGYGFSLFGFSARQRAVLERVLGLHDGASCEYPGVCEGARAVYLCPSELAVDRLPAGVEWTTEFYVERCLHYRELLPADPWARPFYTAFRAQPAAALLRGHAQLTVHMTGFQGVELLHMNKLLGHLERMGVQNTPTLTPKTDVLLVNLAQLNSIPEEHTLRQNKYAAMFAMRREHNQVFRDVMKRKIEFANRHSIPLVTPGFLLELFGRAARAKRDRTSGKLYLNDSNWCIVSPRGAREDYLITLDVSEPALPSPSRAHVDVAAIKLLKGDGKTPAKESGRKAMRQATARPRLAPPSPTPAETHPAKRQKLADLEPLKRSASWGSIMAADSAEPERSASSPERASATDDEENYTQVTYGTSDTKSEHEKPAGRRKTRQSYKDLL